MTRPDRDFSAAFRGRASAQRRLIAAAADAFAGAFTADDLLAASRRRAPRVGPATVYRALASMAEAGFVETVGSRDGAAVYARCRSAGHHHHLVCTACGRVAEADCALEAAVESAERASGFTVTRHEFALYGLCASCAAKVR